MDDGEKNESKTTPTKRKKKKKKKKKKRSSFGRWHTRKGSKWLKQAAVRSGVDRNSLWGDGVQLPK